MIFKNKLDNSLYETLLKNPTDIEKIKSLVKQGADINAADEFGISIVIDLCSYPGLDSGDPDISDEDRFAGIKTAVELGANIHQVTNENFNCLFLATYSYYPPLIKFLLESGVNPNLISEGESVLDSARCDKWIEEMEKQADNAEKMSEIIKLLEQYGAKSSSEILGK